MPRRMSRRQRGCDGETDGGEERRKEKKVITGERVETGQVKRRRSSKRDGEGRD